VAVPLGVVTATLALPVVLAGVTAVTLVADCTTTFDAGAPAIVTIVAPPRFVPVIVMGVPPVDGPLLGLTVEIVGAGT